MRFYIAFLADDEFGIPQSNYWISVPTHVNQNVAVRGIKQMSGPEAIVDKMDFLGFFRKKEQAVPKKEKA